ncbi:MAG TPA: S-layer homology domain-containing protein, partial [Candidatus Ornithomonoglobus intestinigallinarum]|nr:S-layer homology domain-containing protein [Candidatus Ornithomonoglobus intestinigallinarum]
YRLADYSGADMTAGETAEFGDAEAVSDYAAEAVSWAFGEDIINGYGDGTFKPQNTVTRAETAQILRNFSVEIY